MRKCGKRLLSLLLAGALLALGTAVPVHAAAKKLVAITFDDGPGPYTDRLLDGLKQRGVKVTFFMLGSRAEAYPGVVKRAYREGHQIANHSYDHPDLTTLSDSGVKNQIQTTNRILNAACGKGTDYLVRSPYGSETGRTRSLIGAPLIYWSVDPLDWKYRNAETVKNNILQDTFDGAIVLVHDIHSTSVTGALAAIDVLKSRGYELVTVRELFRRRGVSLKKGEDHYSCKPTGTNLSAVAAPTVSNEAEGGRLKVTLSAQPGTKIYYSTDGSDLNQESRVYTQPFYVTTPCTVRAVAAYQMNGSRSGETKVLLATPAAKAPGLRVENGVMTLENRTGGAQVFYTLDGSAADTTSTRYTEPVPLSPGTVISACAGGEGLLDSPQTRGTYSQNGNFFRDIFPSQWYYQDADRAVSAGYLRGVGNDTFAPERNVTRGQLLTLLYRHSGEQVTPLELEQIQTAFTDIPDRAYYTDAVAWGYARGIVRGCDDSSFCPEGTATRQEMSVMFQGYLSYLGAALPDSDGAAGHYRDCGKIAEWALPAVEQMSALGLMQGDDRENFRPRAFSTRGQTAAVLMRLADLLEAQGSGSAPPPELTTE